MRPTCIGAEHTHENSFAFFLYESFLLPLFLKNICALSRVTPIDLCPPEMIWEILYLSPSQRNLDPLLQKKYSAA